MPTTWHIGITGGIASGKSTVARLLGQQYGAFVVDADAVSQAATAAGGLAMPAIAAAFGPDYVTPDGAMNRAAMRALVFEHTQARQRLEKIIHPIVVEQMQQAGHTATSQGHPIVLYDIPLLAESTHWRKRLQHVVVVDCDIPTQTQRAMQRSGLGAERVQAIIAAQASRSARVQIADTVMHNGHAMNLAGLQQQVRQFAAVFGFIIAPKEPPA